MKWNPLVVAASLGIAACAQSPSNAAAPPQQDAAMNPQDQAAIKARMNYQPVEWPLRFERHNFGARCYDTLECHVWYAGMDEGRENPTPPSASFGAGYLDNWNGIRYVDNFPPPAEVKWRTTDGQWHRAEIDIGEIFQDQLVRHSVPREEIADQPDGKIGSTPSILLEVNGRTVRVYMRQRIPLKKQIEIAGHMRHDRRYDLILVKTYSY